MPFDLRRALLRKEEHESARLMEFEFRHRARTFRLMAEALGVDAAEAARLTAGGDDDWVMDELAQIGGATPPHSGCSTPAAPGRRAPS